MVDVSIVIPAYNSYMYLDRCIDSVLGNKEIIFEIILIDDGSTDETYLYCDGYQDDKRFTVIHKKNEGQGVARNLGLSKARGKYVYFLDSDDFLEKDALYHLYNIAEKSDADVVLFTAKVFDDGFDKNTVFSNKIIEIKDGKFLKEIHSGIEMFIYLYKRNEYLASCPRRFYKTSYLRNNNIRFPENIIHEDEWFGYLSLIKANRVLCTSHAYYNRRVRKNSTMTKCNGVKSIIGYMLTIRLLVKYLSNRTYSNEEFVLITNKMCSNLLETVFNTHSNLDDSNLKKINTDFNIFIQEIKPIIGRYSLWCNLYVRFPVMYRKVYKLYNFIKVLRRNIA